jgi:hypothetical protein
MNGQGMMNRKNINALDLARQNILPSKVSNKDMLKYIRRRRKIARRTTGAKG